MSFQAAEGFSQNLLMRMIDLIPVAITVTDLEGRILYYNGYAGQILDRKPEYLGKDIRVCHEKNESIAKIDAMLAEFKSGRTEAFHYEADRYGHRIEVTLIPFDLENKRLGCIQSVTIKK